MKIRDIKAPFYVQFEVTNKCNNKCFFCYNEKAQTHGSELTLNEIKRILCEMKERGVFYVNFNGGEPLMRQDFFEIIEYAHYLNFDLHMNTNATLIDDYAAKRIARCMPSICTSILYSDRNEHDRETGRIGAFDDVFRGISALINNGVKVEVNVCTHKKNYQDIPNIARLAVNAGCHALCSTKYILNNKNNLEFLMDAKSTGELVDILYKTKDEIDGLEFIALTGPIPFCELPVEYYTKLAELNVPCQFGYGLCRISATGKVTPCTISGAIMGDLRKISFEKMWTSPVWDKYRHLCHLPKNCHTCSELSKCRGGCIVYDESILNCGLSINTKKWKNS
jgi:radical SAM protein with 4Fe4S-binding SPASM domain